MCMIINLCGLDGSGKSSQIEQIKKFYVEKGLKCKHIHFPMYGHNQFSDMVTSFLKGDFGDINDVDPYLVANIYAMDRFKYLPELIKDIDEHDIIILDRYIYCNVAFQCAKIKNKTEQIKLKDWILRLEYLFLSLPEPDLILFLDVPINEIEKRLSSDRIGDDRNYLDGKKDIHEKDIEFQKKVRDIYLSFNRSEKNFNVINTLNDKKELYTIEELFNTYKNLL